MTDLSGTGKMISSTLAAYGYEHESTHVLELTIAAEGIDGVLHRVLDVPARDHQRAAVHIGRVAAFGLGLVLSLAILCCSCFLVGPSLLRRIVFSFRLGLGSFCILRLVTWFSIVTIFILIFSVASGRLLVLGAGLVFLVGLLLALLLSHAAVRVCDLDGSAAKRLALQLCNCALSILWRQMRRGAQVVCAKQTSCRAYST